MKETVKAADAAQLLGVSRTYLSDVLSHQPGFPVAIRYSPRGHKHWFVHELVLWREKQQAQNTRRAA